MEVCSCSHALRIGRDRLRQLSGQGMWCLMTKRSNPASKKLHNGSARWGFCPQPCSLAVPMEQIGNHIGVSGRIYVTRADGSGQGSWLPSQEWLLSVLQWGSNIVPNSPRATCNLLRRLQHSPLYHQGMLMCCLQYDGIQCPNTSVWHWHLFFLNDMASGGLTCKRLLYRFCFITSTYIIVTVWQVMPFILLKNNVLSVVCVQKQSDSLKNAIQMPCWKPYTVLWCNVKYYTVPILTD